MAQSDFTNEISNAAISIINPNSKHDPTYFSIAYLNRDVPSDRGVCTDVVTRAYRKIGIDLQKELHEDMKSNFELYPKNWGSHSSDTNIDHRRIPNLMTFFSRKGSERPITNNTGDYRPGEIICWHLGNGIKHIGIVVNEESLDDKRFLIVHNIGNG